MMTHLLSLLTLSLLHSVTPTTTTAAQELLKGFTATPNPSTTSFQPLLSDSSGNYSLSFLRVERTQFALAVIHVPSSEPVWMAHMTRLPPWSDRTHLSFNGSLVISDPHSKVFWSSNSDGDRVFLSNTSNLQIEKTDGVANSVIWQSFEFPSDTLMESQNFTSAMVLVSSNGLYSMKLGFDFIGFYAGFKADSDSGQIYLKHKALEAKADVIQWMGPIYAVLNPDGFLGMYQNGSTPVDVQSFNSFQQPGVGNRRLKLEPDGNLKGYYWTGSKWMLDFQEIYDACELPSSCGPYGLCHPSKGCFCLDNRPEHAATGRGCVSPEQNPGDLCSIVRNKSRVLRKTGVDLPYKELMGYEKMDSLAQCESACELNCTCWGAVYSNSSGFCYMLDYPIQSLVEVGDESKAGYFKVREGAGERKMVVGVVVGVGVGVGLLCGAGLMILCGVLGLSYYRFRRRERGVSGYVEEEGLLGVGPYKAMASASFRSIELSEW